MPTPTPDPAAVAAEVAKVLAAVKAQQRLGTKFLYYPIDDHTPDRRAFWEAVGAVLIVRGYHVRRMILNTSPVYNVSW